MGRELTYLIVLLALSLAGITPIYGDIIWDFENSNDHGFTLWSVNPATPAANDPTIAGDEELTGVGGPNGLPDAGMVWSIGRPDLYDGQKSAFNEGDKAKADGTMEYNQPGKNHPFTFPVNSRGQESYLNTYNHTQWGDNVHSDDNDQIATSPFVLLGSDSQLTVWVHGGGSGTHAPGLDSDPTQGYTTDSAGIAVRSATDDSLLSSVFTNGHGTLREDTIDLSAFAGQTVYIEVVDAFEGSWGWIAVDEIRITNAIEVSVASPYPKAWGPVPADGTMIEDTWTNISWTAGGFAVSHDVYLGDNFDDVNNATNESETFRVNQTLDFYLAGFPGYAYPEGLVPGTTYYWRIDEVNEVEPNSPWRSDVWSFSIPPKTAYFPDPADGSEFVDLNVTLTWTAGFGSKFHYIVFGEDFDEVNNAITGIPNGTTDYNAGQLKLAKTYYWRVDEFDGAETHKGDVWSFSTVGTAGNPNPSNGAVDVKPTTVLSWDAGSVAASHEVYFGMDADAVANATKASPEYKGSKALGDERYEPGKLMLNTTYYWRIEEVNSTNPDSLWPGRVWNFTTGGFLVIDDFEGYNATDNQIWWSWKDGLGYVAHDNEPAFNGNGTGSAVGDETTGSFTEETIVHSGAQSMPIWYDNNKQGLAYYSETELTLTTQRDWTEEDVAELSIWFRGEVANVAEPLYVAVSNSFGNPAIVVNDNPAIAQIDTWTEWVIPLSAFADQGIDLTNIDRIAIGLGTKGNMITPGGSGKMYFDDIRLYIPAP